MAFNLFGLEIKKIDKGENLSAAVTQPTNDDGAQEISGTGAAYYGLYLDSAGDKQSEYQSIVTYRTISLYPEVDIAIQDIVDQAMPNEEETKPLEIDFHEDFEVSDEIKEKIEEEFGYILRLFDYNQTSPDIFRKWYVDGRLAYQVIVDKDNLKRGIVELRNIDALKIKKIREVTKGKSASGVDIISGIEEFFLYNESGFVGTQAPAMSKSTPTTGVKLSPDAVLYVTSGLTDVDQSKVIGFLNKAIRPCNQLRMLEDAMVINRIARAPERRIFYIDVGNLPKAKAEQHVKDIMNQYRNKMVYDANSGELRGDKRHLSLLEDFWLPRRESKNTEIQTLPGAQNLDQFGDVEYFKEKLYQALNIPTSRLQAESGFSLGRTSEISRDEVKFQKFIEKIRKRFARIILDALKTQLILKGICNDVEWEEISEGLRLKFQSDNDFAEQKELDILQTRMAIMPQVDPYLGKYFSKEWVQKNILRLTDKQIQMMDEQINNEKDDPSAQPTFAGGMGGDPNMMGGMDPAMMGGMQPQQPMQQGEDDQEDPNQQPPQQYPFSQGQ